MLIKINYLLWNKCQPKPQGQSRMDNPERYATLDTYENMTQKEKKTQQHGQLEKQAVHATSVGG